MKTKLILTILGAYNALMALLMFVLPEQMGMQLIGETKALENTELLEMATMFHYGLAPALLMIGLLLIFARGCALEMAKRMLLAYIIATASLLFVMFGVFSFHPVIQFSPDLALPDILALGLATFGYLKGK